jgi:hypothetical protein
MLHFLIVSIVFVVIASAALAPEEAGGCIDRRITMRSLPPPHLADRADESFTIVERAPTVAAEVRGVQLLFGRPKLMVTAGGNLTLTPAD